MNAEILDKALEMALEWGENFGKPIQERLRHAFPALTARKADEYQAVCREIKSYAFAEVERAYLKQISDATARANILSKYPLLDDGSMSSLFAQGNYYAWHDNG